ncbi:atos homolog protein B [Pogona vitticeps]
MRHLNAESALPQDCSRGGPSQEEEEEEEEEGEEAGAPPHPWRQPPGVLMGCGPPELTCQKVYQVSIFSPPAAGSHPPEQRSPGRQPIKRTCPEPQRPAEGDWEAKRGCWEPGGGDDAIEDGLLVEDLALGGAAQHFSHSGLRVVEHRQEDPAAARRPQVRRRCRSRDPSPAGAQEGTAPPAPPHIPCDTLHTRDCTRGPLRDGPTASMPPQDEGVGAGGPRSRLGPELHSFAQALPPGEGITQAAARPPDHSTPGVANGLPSSEKTPPCPGPRLPGAGGATRGCPAKRKLLPAVEGAATETASEDESLPPARKKRLLPRPAVPASCRSTDAKGAPFWNHLLPAAKGSVNSSGCSSVRGELKTGLRLKPRHLRKTPAGGGRLPPGPWATTSTSRALLGNFEESMLKGRFPPSGRIEGFTAEIGASGSYCPQHATLPVEVTYFDIAEHSAPSPFLGVIDLETLGKKGYSIPKTGTIQVTLFNPNKTVVKMFLVTYDFHDMPANHVTFLRHRIFLVPVGEEEQGPSQASAELPRRVLCYLMHLRFHSSKSGKIYLHDNIRLLFSRKSIEIDSGIPYELKSFTELPRNPCYSPRA